MSTFDLLRLRPDGESEEVVGEGVHHLMDRGAPETK